MLVPPGVGRRKRDLDGDLTLGETRLVANNSHLSLKHGEILLYQKQFPELNAEFLEEIPLGIVVTMQAWHLSTISSDETTRTICTERNFCELGLNCAVFGPGSLYICYFGAETIARWLANESCQEDNYLMAFQRGANLENCERR